MKYIRNLLVIMICTFFINLTNTLAWGVTASSSVNKGSNVAVKVDASGLIGQFKITSSDGNVLAGGDTVWIEDSSQTLYFTAKNTGSSTITVTAADVATTAGEEFTGSKSVTITVKDKNSSSVDINKVYNSNNNLKSLSVEGYELTPEFDKETLEYSLDLSSEVSNINIMAEVEVKTSKVTGIGEVSVTEGVNKFEVVVTAENGNKKTYILNVNVEDKNPIVVNIDNQEYTVVKNKDNLTKPENYNETTIKVDGVDVPGFYSDITGYNLVGLKNSSGNISLYIYDNSEYKQYYEIKFNQPSIIILDVEDLDKVKGFAETTILINDIEFTAYKLDDTEYYLIYGMNVESGKKDFYLYDKLENNIIKYSEELLDSLKSNQDKYIIGFIVLGLINIIVMISCVVFFIKNKKCSKQ